MKIVVLKFLSRIWSGKPIPFIHGWPQTTPEILGIPNSKHNFVVSLMKSFGKTMTVLGNYDYDTLADD
jgi:hypothetical protein